MKKQMIAACLCLCMLAGCGTAAPAASAQSPSGATETKAMFSDGDYRDVTAETADAEIVLDGAGGTLSDSTRGSSGSTVTVTSKGVYRVSGQSDGVTIRVEDTKKSGNVYLILDHVTMTGEQPCIEVEAADKVVIQCVGENALTATGQESAAIDAEDDLTINGGGTLTLTSAKHGVVCNNDLRLTGATVTVDAAAIGLKAGDSVRVDGATVTIKAEHDGVQVDSDEGDGSVYLAAGSVAIDAGQDAVDVGTSKAESFTGYIELAGGTLMATAGGGSANAKDDTSRKGLKCDGDVLISDGTVLISGADDAVHSGGDVTVTGGQVALSTSDDGIHAEGTLTVSGGEVGIAKSYEGLEAETVLISGGSVAVYAGDDGVNAAGVNSGGKERGPWGNGSTGTITISGGNLYVNAGGDGLDSNGSIYVTGGLTIVEGPTNGGNGAIDRGEGGDCVASVTGGTVLALGSAGMAVNFDSGSQCSALVTLSGNAGDVISVDDGSGFTFTATKKFACAVYSSPAMKQGETYHLTAGENSAVMDFTAGLYYADAAAMGGFGGRGGFPGGDGTTPPDGAQGGSGQRNGPPEGMEFPEGMTPPDGAQGGFGERKGRPGGEGMTPPEGFDGANRPPKGDRGGNAPGGERAE